MKLHKYIGESARSSYERGHDHLDDLKNLKNCSHMLKHYVENHEGEQLSDMQFLMKVKKFHRSAFERQISESVIIQANRHHNLLNSRAEYNRCALPRLSLKIGDKHLKEKDLETILQNEKIVEEKVDEKIRELRKTRRKNPNLSLPARKRLKLNGGVGVTPLNIREIPITKQVKRLVLNGADFPKEPPKKHFKIQEDTLDNDDTAKSDKYPRKNHIDVPTSRNQVPCSTERDIMTQPEKEKKRRVLPHWMLKSGIKTSPKKQDCTSMRETSESDPHENNLNLKTTQNKDNTTTDSSELEDCSQKFRVAVVKDRKSEAEGDFEHGEIDEEIVIEDTLKKKEKRIRTEKKQSYKDNKRLLFQDYKQRTSE